MRGLFSPLYLFLKVGDNMRKQTPLQKQYNQAYKNVEKRIQKLQREGYVFDQSKLPKFRKNISTEGLQHLKKFTESYLKNMPTTRFKVSPTKTTSGARGEEIQRSAIGRKGARTRRYNVNNPTKADKAKAKREEIKRSARGSKGARTRRYNANNSTKLKIRHKDDDFGYDDKLPYRLTYHEEQEQNAKNDAYADALITEESNEYYKVEKDGTIIDRETGEIVYEPSRPEESRIVETSDGAFVDTETGDMFDNPYIDYFSGMSYGQALLDGLDNLIRDYEQSDNRWVREKAEELRTSFDNADEETLADNLGSMSSEFISYVQQIIEESGGNQTEVAENYAKLTEIEALIEGRTLEMGHLRTYFAE